MNEAEFRAELERQGCSDIGEGSIEPNQFRDTHTHPFKASLLVVDGSITLGTDEGSVTYGVGDHCSLEAETPHTESTGPAGVRFLVGRA